MLQKKLKKLYIYKIRKLSSWEFNEIKWKICDTLGRIYRINGVIFINFFILDEEIEEDGILFSFPNNTRTKDAGIKRPIALKFIDSFEVWNYDEFPYGSDLIGFDVQFGSYNKIIGYHKEIRKEIYERKILSK